MKKFILASFVLAIVYFAPILFRSSETKAIPGLISLASILLSFAVMLYTIRNHKLINLGGSISFGHAFSYGFKLTLCSAAIGAIFYFIYIKFNEDSILKITEAAIKQAQENQLETEGPISASHQKKINLIFSNMNNPLIMSVFVFIAAAFYGLIYSLISAAIVKNKTENSFD